jgi:DNA polymerase/3'-5' exonuclease PolX
MYDPVERVQQWGEALAEIAKVIEERQIRRAHEEAKAVPTRFERLEQLATSVTPEEVKRELKRILSSDSDSVMPNFSLFDCEIHLDSPENLQKAFKLGRLSNFLSVLL